MRNALHFYLLSTLIFFTSTFNYAQSLAWAHNLGSDWGSAEGIVTAGVGVDNDGNVIVVGNFNGTADFDPGPENHILSSSVLSNAFVAKYTAEGRYLWAFAISSTANTDAYAMSLDAEGNIVVVGSFQGTADFDPTAGTALLSDKGETDIFIARYTNDGQLQWAKSVGSTGLDRAVDVVVDESLNIIIAGYFHGTVDFDPGDGVSQLSVVGPSYLSNLFFAKYTKSGDFVFVKHIPATSSCIDVALGSSSIFISGTFADTVDFDPSVDTKFQLKGTGAVNLYVARYSRDGNFVYAKAIPNSMGVIINSSFGRGAKSFAVDKDESVYLCGNYTGTADFDPGPDQKLLTASNSSAGYMAKYDPQGSLTWVQNFDADAFKPQCICVGSDGHIVVSGSYFMSCDIDPGPGKTILQNAAYHMFMAEYSSNGSYLSSGSFGGYDQDYITGMTLANNKIVFCGDFTSDSCDIDPGSGIVMLTKSAPVMYNIFVASFNDFVQTGVPDPFNGDPEINILPNPAIDQVTIHFENESETRRASVRDIEGRQVLESACSHVDNHLSIQFLAAGVYTVLISEDGSNCRHALLLKR